MDWRHGSSARSPEFKLQSNQKEKKKKQRKGFSCIANLKKPLAEVVLDYSYSQFSAA
jgi:hypothetical protein